MFLAYYLRSMTLLTKSITGVRIFARKNSDEN